MTRINKLITILAMLVFLPKVSAQQSQDSVDQVLEDINISVEQIEKSNYQLLFTSRSAVLKYIYRNPVNTNNLLSYIGEELDALEAYSNQIVLQATQAEELTGNALQLSVIKDLSSDINDTRVALGINSIVFAHAIISNRSNEVFRAYRLLYNDLRKISQLSEELKNYVSTINTKIYAAYTIKIRLVDAEGNELPEDLMEYYVATNIANQKKSYSNDDTYVDDSGYIENTVFNRLQNGIYIIEGVGVGEISNNEVFIEASMVNEEGYIVLTYEYIKPEITAYDVKIRLVDTNSTEVPVAVLKRYIAIDVATGNAVYDSQDPGGRNIGIFNNLPAGTYRFDAYDGYFDGASNTTVTLSDELIDVDGFITITLGYWSE